MISRFVGPRAVQDVVKDLSTCYLSSLFFALARSAGSVIHSGVMRLAWRPAHTSFASACDPGPGKNRFPIFIAWPVKFGKRALATIAPRAAKVNVSEGWPRRAAARILRPA